MCNPVWIVEHRQWYAPNLNHLDNVVMHVSSSKEKAIEYVRKWGRDAVKQGWYVIYPESVDAYHIYMLGAAAVENCTDPETGNGYFIILDLEGNRLEAQRENTWT